MSSSIILASKSVFRATLLKNAGVEFSVQSAHIDERALEAPFYSVNKPAENVAQILAEAKALNVASQHREALVIGCDQTLSIGNEIFHKPSHMKSAQEQLLKLSGKTHQLNSAVVLVCSKDVIWRHVTVAHMTMRPLELKFIERYLNRVGEIVLSSVGAYQIEGQGIQLFEKIQGDYFTIVGLPLLPLLAELRRIRAIDG